MQYNLPPQARARTFKEQPGMPLMPTFSDEFLLKLSLGESMQVCSEAIGILGWRITEQGANHLKCSEVKPQLVSFTWPVQVEITLKTDLTGATRVALKGSTFGLGALQSNYLKEQLQNLRHTAEHIAGRITASRTENTPPQESRSQAPATLASELEKLARLHASGALDDREFQQAKQRLLAEGGAASGQASPSGRKVVVNNVQLNDNQLQMLEQQYQLRIADGAYWYDRVSGAWGMQGGATLGFTQPNMELGGPLRADASNGNTGVFINGRELHQLDVLALMQLTPYVLPGRYWVDARGVGGYEGGPPMFDLRQLAQAAGGARGGAWSYTSPYGGSVGGDGQGFSYFIDKDTSWTGG
ncbi:MAG TPA: SHOCT domain-containing protein [Pyrinomonadaceae bacterium]